MSGRFGATKAQIFEPKEPEEKDVPIEQDTSKKTGMFGGSTKLQIFEPLEPEEKKVSTDDKTNLIVTKTTQKQCSDIKLSKGCRGKNVQEMQKKLIACGYSLPKKGADGIFGPETKAAIINFQKDNSLKADGVAGKETLKALESCKTKNRDIEEKPSKEPTPLPKEKTSEPEISAAPKTMEPVAVQPKVNTPLDDLTSRETVKKESILKRTLNIIKNRNDSIENIVFERLVKGCK